MSVRVRGETGGGGGGRGRGGRRGRADGEGAGEGGRGGRGEGMGRKGRGEGRYPFSDLTDKSDSGMSSQVYSSSLQRQTGTRQRSKSRRRQNIRCHTGRLDEASLQNRQERSGEAGQA